MLDDASTAPAILAPVPHPAMLAYAAAPAILASVPHLAMLAYAAAPAILADAPLPSMLAMAAANTSSAPAPGLTVVAQHVSAALPAELHLLAVHAFTTVGCGGGCGISSSSS